MNKADETSKPADVAGRLDGLVRPRLLKRAKKFDHYNDFAKDIVALCVDHERLERLVADYEEMYADHRRLVREMDVALNGEAGAAKQASLCDIVAQVKRPNDGDEPRP